METKRVVKVDIQRSQLAVIGLNNVSVIDTRVNKLNNDYQDFIDVLHNNGSNSPIFSSAIKAKDATADNVTALGGAGVTLEDKIAVIALPTAFNTKIVNQAVAGLLIAEKYMHFSQGSAHTVEIIPIIQGVEVDTINKRILNVENTGEVNTVSEYIVLPTMQPRQLGPLVNTAYHGGTVPVQSTYSRSAGNYLTPWPLGPINGGGIEGSYTLIVVVFKGMASQDEAQLSVTPIFAGFTAAKQLSEIFNS